MGIDEMEKQLVAMGYQPVRCNDFVCFEFAIPHGKFRGHKIEIALQAPQFPDIPPPGPNIKPFLLPINSQAGSHPYYGIHDRKTPDAAFQYWSRPFTDWDKTEKTMKVYISFLRTLFDFE